jgi:hypothetical protein
VYRRAGVAVGMLANVSIADGRARGERTGLFGTTDRTLSSSMLAVPENLGVLLPGALFFMYFHKLDLVTASLSSRNARY